MAESYGAPAAPYPDFVDRLTDLLFRKELDPVALNGSAEREYARLNDNALKYSYCEVALRPMVARAEIIGWETSQGLFVPRQQFKELGLTLHPAIKDLWDIWAPSTHSKITDSRTPRTAIFWAALSLAEMPQPTPDQPARTIPLLTYIHEGGTSPAVPLAIRESFRDISRVSDRVAAFVLASEVSSPGLLPLVAE